MLIDKMKVEITRFTWKATEDFGVASTTLETRIPIWGTDYVVGIYGRIKTAFAGITGPVTMQIGTTGEPHCIMRDTNLNVADECFLYMPLESWYCTLLLPTHRKHGRYDMEAPLITFTSSSGNLEDLTAGEIELVVMHIVPEK